MAAAREVVAAQPDHARAQSLLGAACAAVGQRECAHAAFDAAIRDSPRDPSRYVNAGLFQLQSGESVGRGRAISRARSTIDPSLEAGARRPRASARSPNVILKNELQRS